MIHVINADPETVRLARHPDRKHLYQVLAVLAMAESSHQCRGWLSIIIPIIAGNAPTKHPRIARQKKARDSPLKIELNTSIFHDLDLFTGVLCLLV